jgi:hypothetical protein
MLPWRRPQACSTSGSVPWRGQSCNLPAELCGFVNSCGRYGVPNCSITGSSTHFGPPLSMLFANAPYRPKRSFVSTSLSGSTVRAGGDGSAITETVSATLRVTEKRPSPAPIVTSSSSAEASVPSRPG